VEVNFGEGIVYFTAKKNGEIYQFQQKADILTQHTRAFVPYLELKDKGDQITW
jgi:hypothetical protein